jgi:hypothetical protein
MKNIVFMTAVQLPGRESRSAPYGMSIRSWKEWCRRNDCDLFVLEETVLPIEQMKIKYNIYYAFQILRANGIAFDQLCVVDSDTLIHPDCPNFFHLTDHKFAVVRDDGDFDWIIRSIENYQHEFPGEFRRPFYIWDYFNAGFLVTNARFEYIFDELMHFYWKYHEKIGQVEAKYGVGTDQPLLNLFIQETNKYPRFLPYNYNMVNLYGKGVLDGTFRFLRIPGIYHFNGIPGGDESTVWWMTQTYQKLGL